MKPTWIYEHGVFGTEEQPEADELFVAALRKHGLEVLGFDKNSMLTKEFTPKIREAKFERVPVYRGSFRNCRATGLDQQVGIGDWSNYNCSAWLTHFGDIALNRNCYSILSLSELWRRKREILDLFNSKGDLFIRPDSGLKQFHGGLLDLSSFSNRRELYSYLRQDKAFKVFVAPTQKIVNEWRCFMYGSTFVTGSRYTFDSKGVWYPILPNSSLVPEVEEIVRSACWYPSVLWSIDFCTTSRIGNHELKVVELGSYHCAGVYASDLDKYIEAANDFAIKMSNEDDN